MILYPYRDCIGVYRSDAEYRAGKNPVEVIRTPILSLPESDQSALLRGIPLQNEEQLRQLREDFS